MSLHANILCQICAGIATLSLSSILIWFYQYMQTHVSKADSEHLRYLSEAELVVRLGLSYGQSSSSGIMGYCLICGLVVESSTNGPTSRLHWKATGKGAYKMSARHRRKVTGVAPSGTSPLTSESTLTTKEPAPETDRERRRRVAREVRTRRNALVDNEDDDPNTFQPAPDLHGKRLPPFILDMFAKRPHRGGGLNNWFFRIARVLHAFHTMDEIKARLHAEAKDEPLQEGEIERAVERSYECRWQPREHTTRRKSIVWSPVNEVLVNEIAATGGGIAAWEKASPVKWDDNGEGRHGQEIIDALLPGAPFICCGKYVEKEFNTHPRNKWGAVNISPLQFIVPNGMTDRTGLNQDGKISVRCLENTGPRQNIVIEFDEEKGPDGFDRQANLLAHLATFARIALIVRSGGKSLHAWVPCSHQSEENVMRFFNYAHSLGADELLWTECQFVRMPDGTRHDDKHKEYDGAHQRVIYFDPDAVKAEADKPWGVPPLELPPQRPEPRELTRRGEDSRNDYQEAAAVVLALEQMPPIKTVGRTWYAYEGGVWRTTNHHIFRPIALCVQDEESRSDYRAGQILRHIESSSQVHENTLRSFYMMDGDTVVLNAANGIVRVAPEGKVVLSKHDPGLNFTRQLEAGYDTLARCPTFSRVLKEALPDDDDRALLQHFVGSTLLPSCKYEAALVCYGPGGTGKGTIAEPIASIFGTELVERIGMSNICDPKGYYLPKLKHVALNLGTELDALEVSESGNFKLLVSGEPIDVRPIYGAPFTMSTTAKLWFLSNNMPRFKQGTDAEQRRMRFLRFDKKPAAKVVGLRDKIKAGSATEFSCGRCKV